jgi:hypothetical protein
MDPKSGFMRSRRVLGPVSLSRGARSPFLGNPRREGLRWPLGKDLPGAMMNSAADREALNVGGLSESGLKQKAALGRPDERGQSKECSNGKISFRPFHASSLKWRRGNPIGSTLACPLSLGRPGPITGGDRVRICRPGIPR